MAVYPFCVSLFGDNRGLRFSCADFGWRIFYFGRKYIMETSVKFITAFYSSLIISLFVFSLKKLKTKKEVKVRLSAFLCVSIFFILFSVIYSLAVPEEKGGAWAISWLYFLLFGWRIIADLVSYKNKQDEKGSKFAEIEKSDPEIELSQKRVSRWAMHAEKEKKILEGNEELAKKIYKEAEQINAAWSNVNFESEQRCAEIFIDIITPELFIDKYDLFKAGNRDDIRDGIYLECPYLILDTIINMALYIFKTKNNIYILNYILKSECLESINLKQSVNRLLKKEEMG